MNDIRSLLFVPGDSDRKIAKGLESAADALILDLEDAVAPGNKARARASCREVLQQEQGKKKRLIVRVNALVTEEALFDLAAVVGGKPFGIMLPKCGGIEDIRTLDRYLSALEVREKIEPGSIQILPVMTETAAAVFGSVAYDRTTPRLAGMLWGGEDLAADIGARQNRDASGSYTAPYQHARMLCLLSAAASEATAIDAVYTDFRDSAGLRAETEAAARDGFTAKAAIHPDQIEIINDVLTPTEFEIEYALKVVDLFQDMGTSVAQLDGKMLDRPHLIAARKILARAQAAI